MAEQIIFYAFAALLVFAATMVVTVRNPVHAALSLVLAFVASASLWLMAEAEFLAIALVLVYVGAVMVLLLFVVMMLDINLVPRREGFVRFLPIGGVVTVLFIAAIAWVVGREPLGPGLTSAALRHGPEYSNVAELGGALYTDYLFAFEVAAALLLVAIVAAIALALRPSRQTRRQRPDRQVAVRRDDRVRLVKLTPQGRR